MPHLPRSRPPPQQSWLHLCPHPFRSSSQRTPQWPRFRHPAWASSLGLSGPGKTGQAAFHAAGGRAPCTHFQPLGFHHPPVSMHSWHPGSHHSSLNYQIQARLSKENIPSRQQTYPAAACTEVWGTSVPGSPFPLPLPLQLPYFAV